MEKFSFYELLSFLIPGFLVLLISENYLSCFGFDLSRFYENSFLNTVLLIVISLVIGLIIHSLTFKLLEYRWYERFVYKPVNDYIRSSKERKLNTILPFINESLPLEFINSEIQPSSENLPADNDEQYEDNKNSETSYYPLTFNFAYYYLEVNGKISQSMRFQSLYFLFRNLFTISLIHLIVFLLMAIVSIWVYSLCVLPFWKMSVLFVFLILITFLIARIASFLRGKMIDRVLWSYYIVRKFENEKNN